MSRTKRGSKGPGFDYWSRRPASGNGFGPDIKDQCHSTERAQAKQETIKELKELEDKE